MRLLGGRQLPGKELFVLRLEGIDDRTAAEALVGQELLVPAADRPNLARANSTCSIWWGWRCASWRNRSPGNSAGGVGTVKDLIHAGNDLLEVEPAGGGAPLWIPFVEAIVPEVKLEAGWIGITPPPGLLDLGAASNCGTSLQRAWLRLE